MCVRLWLTCMCMIMRYALRSFIWNFSSLPFWSIYHLSKFRGMPVGKYLRLEAFPSFPLSTSLPSPTNPVLDSTPVNRFPSQGEIPTYTLHRTVLYTYNQSMGGNLIFAFRSLPSSIYFLHPFPFIFIVLPFLHYHPFRVSFLHLFSIFRQWVQLLYYFIPWNSFFPSFIPVLISALISPDPNISLIWSDWCFDPIWSDPTGSGTLILKNSKASKQAAQEIHYARQWERWWLS